jgi:hypothetical protein
LQIETSNSSLESRFLKLITVGKANQAAKELQAILKEVSPRSTCEITSSAEKALRLKPTRAFKKVNYTPSKNIDASPQKPTLHNQLIVSLLKNYGEETISIV